MPTKQHLRTPPEVIRKNRNRMRVHLNSNLQSNLTFLGLLHHIYIPIFDWNKIPDNKKNRSFVSIMPVC